MESQAPFRLASNRYLSHLPCSAPCATRSRWCPFLRQRPNPQVSCPPCWIKYIPLSILRLPRPRQWRTTHPRPIHTSIHISTFINISLQYRHQISLKGVRHKLLNNRPHGLGVRSCNNLAQSLDPICLSSIHINISHLVLTLELNSILSMLLKGSGKINLKLLHLLLQLLFILAWSLTQSLWRHHPPQPHRRFLCIIKVHIPKEDVTYDRSQCRRLGEYLSKIFHRFLPLRLDIRANRRRDLIRTHRRIKDSPYNPILSIHLIGVWLLCCWIKFNLHLHAIISKNMLYPPGIINLRNKVNYLLIGVNQCILIIIRKVVGGTLPFLKPFLDRSPRPLIPHLSLLISILPTRHHHLLERSIHPLLKRRACIRRLNLLWRRYHPIWIIIIYMFKDKNRMVLRVRRIPHPLQPLNRSGCRKPGTLRLQSTKLNRCTRIIVKHPLGISQCSRMPLPI